MAPRRTLLLLASLIAVLGIAVAATGHSGNRWLAPIGIMMVLVLPGYALSVALLPDLSGTVRALITMGLSLVVAVLGGLLLNILPWGLRPLPWAIWLGGVTLVSSMVALAKGAGEGEAARLPRPKLTVTSAAGLIAAAVLVGVSFQAAQFSASEANTHFTQLWAVPMHSGNQDSLEVGVRNEEVKTLSYRVVVLDGNKTVAEWNIANLKPGDQQTKRVDVVVQPSTTRLDVHLVRTDSPNEVYRAVEISPEAFSTP